MVSFKAPVLTICALLILVTETLLVESEGAAVTHVKGANDFSIVAPGSDGGKLSSRVLIDTSI
jgi:hypothetical protein